MCQECRQSWPKWLARGDSNSHDLLNRKASCQLDDMPSSPRTCPTCGTTNRHHRSNRTLYCKTCYNARYKGHVPCPGCGGPKTRQAAQCRQCRWGPDAEPRQMSPVQVAWLAGLLEGEGTFVSKRRPHIAVAMTDQDVVQRLLDWTGLGRIHSVGRQKDHHKPAWIWTVRRRAHIQHLVRLVRPWLGERRGVAADALLQRVTSKEPA